MIIYHENLKYDVCELIINKFDELNNKKIVSQKTNDDIRIFGFEKVLDTKITNFFFDIDTKSSIKFFKKKPLNQTLMVNKTFVPPNKLGTGSGDGWHRDSYFKKQLKTIFYLTKVNIENGPFTYLEPKFKIFSRLYPIKSRLSAEKSIFLNATGTTTTPTLSNAFFVDPIRNLDGSNILQYNSMTKEITFKRILPNISIQSVLCINGL